MKQVEIFCSAPFNLLFPSKANCWVHQRFCSLRKCVHTKLCPPGFLKPFCCSHFRMLEHPALNHHCLCCHHKVVLGTQGHRQVEVKFLKGTKSHHLDINILKDKCSSSFSNILKKINSELQWLPVPFKDAAGAMHSSDILIPVFNQLRTR